MRPRASYGRRQGWRRACISSSCGPTARPSVTHGCGRLPVTVAYLALAPDLADPSAGTDAAHAEWVAVPEAVESRLAFDHAVILRDALERAARSLSTRRSATNRDGGRPAQLYRRGNVDLISPPMTRL